MWTHTHTNMHTDPTPPPFNRHYGECFGFEQVDLLFTNNVRQPTVFEIILIRVKEGCDITLSKWRPSSLKAPWWNDLGAFIVKMLFQLLTICLVISLSPCWMARFFLARFALLSHFFYYFFCGHCDLMRSLSPSVSASVYETRVSGFICRQRYLFHRLHCTAALFS